VAAAGSELVVDYIDHEAFVPERCSARVREVMARASAMGEPFITGFDPETLGAALAPTGFRLLENLGPRDIDGRFFGGRIAATEHSWFARATTIPSPGRPRTGALTASATR
jgi:O-methyltransferase involved in polyketide biosynthesis